MRCWPVLSLCWVLLLPLPASATTLLEQLGMSGALRQMDALLNLSLAGEPLASALDDAQRQRVFTQLSETLAPEALELEVLRRMDEVVPAQVKASAKASLDSELAQRARNFDQVFGMEGVPARFQAYRQQLAAQPPRAERRALMRALDTAGSGAAHAAWLQTTVEDCVLQAAIAQTDEPLALAPREQRLREREAALREMAVDLSLYSYRFMRDEELSAYHALLEAEPLQQVLNAAWRSLDEVLSQRCTQ